MVRTPVVWSVPSSRRRDGTSENRAAHRVTSAAPAATRTAATPLCSNSGGNNWLGIKLQGVTCNRDAIGSRILWKAGGKLYQRMKNSGGSYLSSHDPRGVGLRDSRKDR